MSATVELAHATALFTDRSDGDLGRTEGPATVEVLGNRAALLARHGLPGVAVPRQVHGAVVATVERCAGYEVAVATADGLATTASRTPLAVHVADCLPIVIAGAGGVSVVHAGWRGLASGVIARGVAELRALGVSGRLEAAIGPAAAGCCYEAGAEVHEALGRSSVKGHGRIDLPALAAVALTEVGVASVTAVGVCTLCAPRGTHFSHRRDGPDTGRQAGIAWIR